jgi:hypothetical protein
MELNLSLQVLTLCIHFPQGLGQLDWEVVQVSPCLQDCLAQDIANRWQLHDNPGERAHVLVVAGDVESTPEPALDQPCLTFWQQLVHRVLVLYSS